MIVDLSRVCGLGKPRGELRDVESGTFNNEEEEATGHYMVH